MTLQDELIESFQRVHTVDGDAAARMWERLDAAPAPAAAPSHRGRAVAAVALLAAAAVAVMWWGQPESGLAGSPDDAGSVANYVAHRDTPSAMASETSRSNPRAPVEEPKAPAPPPPPPEDESRPEVDPSAPSEETARAPHATPRKHAAPTEVELLGKAQALLRDGKPKKTLDALRRYRRYHPRGTLREDAAALKVLALCDAKRKSEAKKAGEAFLSRHPSSPHAGRIRRSCAAPSN